MDLNFLSGRVYIHTNVVLLLICSQAVARGRVIKKKKKIVPKSGNTRGTYFLVNYHNIRRIIIRTVRTRSAPPYIFGGRLRVVSIINRLLVRNTVIQLLQLYNRFYGYRLDKRDNRTTIT